MKKIIATDAAPAAIGPYSQGVDGGGIVITSGQLPIDVSPALLPKEASPGRPGSLWKTSGLYWRRRDWDWRM